MTSASETKPIYFLKKPTGKRKTFAVIGYTQPSDKREYFTVKASEIDAVNRQYKAGNISAENAATQLQDFITELYKRQDNKKMAIKRSGLFADNEKLLNAYWQDRYKRNNLVDPESHWADLVRAVKLVGDQSLYVADFTDIEDAVEKNATSIAQARRAIDRLNEILTWAERATPTDRLHKPDDDIKDVRHLTRAEVEKLVKKMNSVDADLTLALFGTGCRMGEIMAVRAQALRGKYLYIDRQMTIKGKVKLPKRGRKGDTVIIPFTLDALKRWIAVEDKQAVRAKYRDRLKAACRQVWPTNKEKWIRPHDLRHSYAIHSLNKGATLKMVSQSLRNRIEVCERYYTGFVHTDQSLDAMAKLLDD